MRLKRDGSSDSLLNNGPRSEYVKRYQVYPLQKTRSYRPTNEVIRASEPIDSETVFRRDYPEHPLPKWEAKGPAQNNLKAEGEHDFTSSYQNEFHGKMFIVFFAAFITMAVTYQTTDGQNESKRPTERRKPYKPDTTRPDLAAFDAQPSYREDYPEWDLPKKQARKRVQWNPPDKPFEGQSTTTNDYKEHQLTPRVKYGDKQEWHPPDKPFKGKSTTTNDYKEHQVTPRVKYGPDNNPVQSDAPFNANSDYKDTYKEHPLPPKVQREKEQWSKPAVPIDDLTTQQRDYRGEFVPKQKSMKPDIAPIKSDMPIEGDTTTSLSYRPHDLPKRHRHEPKKYTKPEGDMDLNTTTASQFKEYPLQRQEIQKPGSSHLLRGTGEMSRDTNYSQDYHEHPINRATLMKPKNDYMPPTVPMEFQTEYQADFYEHQPGPRESFKPKDAPLHSDEPFDDRTDYRDKFMEHKVTPRQQRPKEVYTRPTAPLDTRTTARESYTGPYQPKRESFKQDQNLVKSNIPFDNSTTTNTDFKPHEVTRRELHKGEPYQKPVGDMDLTTSHNAHYKEHQLQRQKLERPVSSNLLKGTGEMSSKTNYQGDFVEHPAERRQNMKPSNIYQPPSDPMTNETTHRADFFERQLQQREPFKPKDDLVRSDAPLDDRTGYRDSFVAHAITPREMRPKDVHKPPLVPFEDRTTARDSYQGAFLPKREALRPDKNPVKSDAPFEGNTTTNTDFKEHQLPERYKYKPDSYHKPVGQMDLITTHTTNYTEHPLQKQTMSRPESSGVLRGFGEMRKDTNYQGDFKQPPPMKREVVKPKSDYKPPSAPMDSITTNQISYREHGLSQQVSFKPKNEYTKPDIPFEDRTDYQDKFMEHQVTPRQPVAKETYKPPSAPFDSRTTSNQAFIGAFQPKRESFRPDHSYVKSDAPIESDTTSSQAFKQWPVSKRTRLKPEQYIKPDGFMDLTTINRETYKEVRGERPTMFKTGSSNILSYNGQFQNNTSYSSDFVAKSLGQTKRWRPDNQYVPSTLPFADKTEYRDSHVGYVAPKEKSFRPNGLSDALGQRDPQNPFHIRDCDWHQMMNRMSETTVKG